MGNVIKDLNNCKNKFVHINATKQDSNLGPTHLSLLEFETCRVRPFSHYGRFTITVLCCLNFSALFGVALFLGPKLVILGTQLPKCIRLKRDYKPVLLCISTSLWVLAEPKSWLRLRLRLVSILADDVVDGCMS